MAQKSSTEVVKANEVKIIIPEVLTEKFEALKVSKQEASALLVNFGVPLVEVGEILETYKAIEVKSAEDTEQQAKAREVRLKLKKIRTGVENTRKNLKEEYLRKGNAIQAVANYIRETIEPAEAYLQLQEDFIKVQEEKAAADRIAKRTEQLAALDADPSVYSLGDMSEDAFESLLTGIKDANEAKALREKNEAEAAAKLEAERVAHEQELAAENAKLKAEADAREKLAAEEKAKADALLAAEKVKSDALAKAAADKEAAEAAERAAALKAEQDAIAEREAAAKAAQLAPDKDKITSFMNGLQIVVDTRLPQVESEEAKAIVGKLKTGLENYIKLVLDEAGKL